MMTEESYGRLGSWPTLGAQKAGKTAAMARADSWLLGFGAKNGYPAPSRGGKKRKMENGKCTEHHVTHNHTDGRVTDHPDHNVSSHMIYTADVLTSTTHLVPGAQQHHCLYPCTIFVKI